MNQTRKELELSILDLYMKSKKEIKGYDQEEHMLCFLKAMTEKMGGNPEELENIIGTLMLLFFGAEQILELTNQTII
jgi:hypothetical protein